MASYHSQISKDELTSGCGPTPVYVRRASGTAASAVRVTRHWRGVRQLSGDGQRQSAAPVGESCQLAGQPGPAPPAGTHRGGPGAREEVSRCVATADPLSLSPRPRESRPEKPHPEALAGAPHRALRGRGAVSRTTWKPSLEERAILWVIRHLPGSAHKSPRIAEHVFRWVRDGNQRAIRETTRALRNQKVRPVGRPPKALPDPGALAFLHDLLDRVLRPLPHAEVKDLLLKAGVPVERVATVSRGQHKRAANLLIRRMIGSGDRAVKGTLARGRRSLREPPRVPSLLDIAGLAGKLGPLEEFLATVQPEERGVALLSFFPDIFSQPSS